MPWVESESMGGAGAGNTCDALFNELPSCRRGLKSQPRANMARQSEETSEWCFVGIKEAWVDESDSEDRLLVFELFSLY